MATLPPHRFYERDPVTVARALLGQRLVRVLDGHRLSGLIVETEAYLGVPDKAAHTFGGRRTARNASMWLTGGHAYIYFTYGMHHCLNVVAGREGEPVAVLIRAIEPVEGLDVMRSLRVALRRARTKSADTELASGPARLCQAMGIDRALDGTDLTRGDGLFIEQVRKRVLPSGGIAVGPRIGVDYAGEWAKKPLRFWVRGNAHVSK
ncbi:MAG: DNA-3-methyladenine glycosylase [Phycisphaeraceae bacterium]|nr:DNA-3-methyladenine glycosylase [Phycisphaeraceae bacterium]